MWVDICRLHGVSLPAHATQVRADPNNLVNPPIEDIEGGSQTVIVLPASMFGWAEDGW